MKHIYLKIHYKDTKEAISNHITKYNEQLYNTNPKEYRKKKIKAGVELTVFAVLDMYSSFLHKNAKYSFINPVFRMNNQALVTKYNGRISKATIWRHLKVAYECKIFDKDAYKFHGSNSSYEMSFNHELLVACPDEEYTKLVVNKYRISVNNQYVSGLKLKELESIRPLFKDAFNGCMISFCYNTVPVKIQEQNINMVTGVLVNNALLPFSLIPKNEFLETEKSVSVGTIGQEQRSIYQFNKNELEQREKGERFNCIKNEKVTIENAKRLFPQLLTNPLNKRPEHVLRENLNKNNGRKYDPELIKYHTEMGLKLAKSVLYKGREISDFDEKTAKNFITNYYSPADMDLKYSDLASDFNLAIFEAYKAMYRKNYYPAPLYKYFDPHFTGGFYRTLKHVQVTVKPFMEKNKEFSDSIREVRDLYQKVMEKPNDYDTYRKATQFLGKKKNKIYLQFFNDWISNPDKINSSDANRIWQKEFLIMNES